MRFVDELRPSKGVVFAGTVIVLIEGIGTAAITIQTPSGPREILLAEAAFVPDFHTNLASLTKFNEKDVWWDNRRNLLYEDDHETFAYCERHCNQSTLEYNEPRPRTLSKASVDPIPDQEGLQESSDELNETSDKLNEILDENQEDIGGS